MCNGCNGVSLGDHGVPEGDRIPCYYYYCYYYYPMTART